jgi:hypothetical protein
MTTESHSSARATFKVRIRENTLRLKIIVLVENEHLAWGGSRWIPLNADGLAVGDVRPVSFTTQEGATSYAENQGFKVEHPND